MRRHWLALVALALLASAPAFAQYVATVSQPGSVPYPTLTGGTSIGLMAPAMAAPNDHGRADVQLGFTFPYFNRTYTRITVTANGMLFLEPSSGANVTSAFGFNFAMPNPGAEPYAIIAPFWDDLDGKNATSVIRRQAVSGPDGQGLAIEWANWSQAFGTYNLNFQVRLWENGLIDFYYGDMFGTGGSPSISCGIESPNGAVATQCRPCTAADGGVAGPAACTLADFPSDTWIRFGPPPGPDISIGRLQVDSIVPTGPNLSITTTVTLRNFGTLASGAFKYRLYLSADTVYTPGVDAEISPTPRSVASIPALSSTSQTVTGTVARPMSGTYYVLIVADSDGEVNETNEFNNTAINGVPLQNGVDLVAENITGPPLGGPGDPVTNVVTFSNQGIDPAGSVRLRIHLSLDPMLDVTDRQVYDGTITVAGGQNVQQPITYTLPGNIAAADYFFILEIDPLNTIPELLETNNIKVATARFTAMQADLIIEQIRVLRPAAPFNPATVAFFGEPIRLEAVVKNQGGASAPNVRVAFYLSDNETLNGITDPLIIDVPASTLASGQSAMVSTTANVPTRAVDMTPLAPGPYFFFAAAIGPGLMQTTTTNDFLRAPPIRVRGPAPDLLPTLVSGPMRIGAGEQMVVTRTLANFGNRPAAGVRYRYYLSANTIVTSGDLALKIKTDAGLVDDLSVSLAVDESKTATEIVEVPVTAQPATYYLGVLLDPEQQVDEVDHENNGLAGQQIEVVPPGLQVDTVALPDAVLGREYAAQLSGRGGDGNYTWSFSPGSMPPPGLTLSPAGVISGTPSAEGAFSLGLRVTSAGFVTDAVRVLRVVRPTSSVFIRTVDLPSPARMVDYEARLTAGGGRAPYSWEMESGVLPQGLSLSWDGTISGQAVQALGMSFNFAIRVRDSVGNTDVKSFRMVIVDGTALIISTYELQPATVGALYNADIAAKSAGGAPLATPLTWSLSGGFLPTGLTLGRLDEKLLVTGTPLVSGIFPFQVEVVDARGRSDTCDLILEVRAPSIQVRPLTELPERVVRNTEVSVQFAVLGPVPPGVKWIVRDGALPKGLTLDEAGLLSGTVASDAEYGPYTFTVGPTADGQVLTFGSFAIEVVETINARRGCSVGGGELLALAAVAMLLRRRRR